jgi:CRP-like cAMP-binding protein
MKQGTLTTLGLQNPRHNHLLAALPANESDRIFPCLESIPLKVGDVLSHCGSQAQYVYFPTDCIISMLHMMQDGSSTEVATVGNEGLVGIELFMGGGGTPRQEVVQRAGHGYRLRASILKAAFEQRGTLQNLLLRYTQALITQMAQIAVCNRHHRVEQQLCRWLLLSLDRMTSNDVAITQERIANMLGVRREGVTEAACRLQKAGLLQCRRGHIAVIDRTGLEAHACECYRVVRNEFERLLPLNGNYPADAREPVPARNAPAPTVSRLNS